MARILVINPNCSAHCTAGIDTAVERFRRPDGPAIDVVTLTEGPPAIYTWRDWHAVVEPLCQRIERESAELYIIACASDPGIEAARAATRRPVLGVFRSAIAAALAGRAGSGRVAAIVSGGNIDLEKFAQLTESSGVLRSL